MGHGVLEPILGGTGQAPCALARPLRLVELPEGGQRFGEPALDL
jgi:hypothetical protein